MRRKAEFRIAAQITDDDYLIKRHNDPPGSGQIEVNVCLIIVINTLRSRLCDKIEFSLIETFPAYFPRKMTTVDKQDPGLLRRLTVGLMVAAAIALPSFAQSKPVDELQIKRCWEHRYAGTGEDQLTGDSISIYMVRDGSIIDAVSRDTGVLRWTSDLGGSVASNLILRDQTLFVVRRTIVADTNKTATAELRAISTSTGITKWNTSLPDTDSFTLWATRGAIAVVSGDGTFRSVLTADGSIKSPVQASVGLAVVAEGGDDGRMYYVTDEKEIRYLATGEEKSLFVARSPFKITSIGMGPEDSMIWGDERGNLTSFGVAENKLRWQFKSGAKISDIARVNGFVLAASNDDFVYAISPGSGNRVWKRRMSGRIQAMDAVGGRNVLVSTVGGHGLLLLSAKDGKIVGQVSLGDDETPIAATVIDASSFAVLTQSSLSGYSLGDCIS